MISSRKGNLFKLLCVVVLCVLVSMSCLAENGVPHIKVADGESIPNGIGIKKELRNKGYYDPDVPDDVFVDNVLDPFTMNALGKLAITYPDRPAYDGDNKGMTNEAWWDLDQNAQGLSKSIKSIAVTEHEGYVDIYEATQGQSKIIEEIQKRLIDLNYLKRTDVGYKPGEVSPALFTALKAFLERNGKPELYTPDVITVAVQEKLLDTDPSLLEPAENKKFRAKLRDYFSSSKTILSLNVPMLVIWFLSIILLAVCVVLFIHFFKNDSSGKDASKKSLQMFSQRRRGKNVTFEITYGGVTTTHDRAVDGLLKIGRNVGDFPLNLEDTSVSRLHCDLYFDNKKLMLHDHSSGGTLINGEKINNTTRSINSGDVLSIGYHTIKITY